MATIYASRLLGTGPEQPAEKKPKLQAGGQPPQSKIGFFARLLGLHDVKGKGELVKQPEKPKTDAQGTQKSANAGMNEFERDHLANEPVPPEKRDRFSHPWGIFDLVDPDYFVPRDLPPPEPYAEPSSKPRMRAKLRSPNALGPGYETWGRKRSMSEHLLREGEEISDKPKSLTPTRGSRHPNLDI